MESDNGKKQLAFKCKIDYIECMVYLLLFFFCGFAAQRITHHKINDELYRMRTQNIENRLLNMINDTEHCGHSVK
jgi:hypothetical protein